MSVSQQEARRVEQLEARVAVLERQVLTLAAAADAASRLRLSTERDTAVPRIVGGEWVRHILEKSGLVGEEPTSSRADGTSAAPRARRR